MSGVFWLDRRVDASGVSGTGIVAEGYEFSDGVVALRWMSDKQSTAIYDNMNDLIAIHGHGGKTNIVRADD